MSSLHPARRRAERFDAAVEGSSTAGLDPRLLDLVELVGALRETPQPVPRAEFVTDLRASLLLAAETDLVRADREPVTPAVRRTRRERRLAVALGGLAVVGATTSMAVAAQSALPGEVLYPVKRAIEDADTRLTADDQRGVELLDHASGRLDELDLLSRETLDEAQTRAAQDALATFSAQASEASDLLIADHQSSGSDLPITELRDFTGQSVEQLSALESQLPPLLRPALLDAARVLVDIDQAAGQLCPECGSGIVDLPGSLLTAGLPLLADDPSTVLTAEADQTPTGQLQAPQAAPTPLTQPEAAPPAQPAVPDPSPLGADDTTAEGSGSTASMTDGKGAGKGVKKKLDDTLKGVGGTATTPATPVPSTLGQVIEDTVDELTGTLLDPLK